MKGRQKRKKQKAGRKARDHESKKDVFLMGLTSFFNDFGSEMVTPVLPFFLASLGAGSSVVGIFSAIRDGVPTLLKYFGGVIGDRFGRKLATIIGYLISALSKLLLAFSGSLGLAFAFYSSGRIGKGLRDPPRDSMISTLMKRHRAEAFGIHQALDSLGAVVGAVAVLVLLYMHASIFLIMVLSGAVSFLSVLPLLKVKEKDGGMHDPYTDHVPLVFYLLSFIIGFSMFGVMLMMAATGSIISSALAFIIFNIFFAMGAYPAGLIADYKGERLIIGAGLLAIILTCILFTQGLVIAAFAVYGIAFSLLKGNFNSFVGNTIGTSSKTYGAIETVLGVGTILGNIALGFILELYGINVGFSLPIIASLVSLFILVFLVSGKGR